MSTLVNEYRPGSGAMASQAEADMVSVILRPVAKVALAAPAQQSNRIRQSDIDLSKRICMALHLSNTLEQCTMYAVPRHCVLL